MAPTQVSVHAVPLFYDLRFRLVKPFSSQGTTHYFHVQFLPSIIDAWIFCHLAAVKGLFCLFFWKVASVSPDFLCTYNWSHQFVTYLKSFAE